MISKPRSRSGPGPLSSSHSELRLLSDPLRLQLPRLRVRIRPIARITQGHFAILDNVYNALVLEKKDHTSRVSPSRVTERFEHLTGIPIQTYKAAKKRKDRLPPDGSPLEKRKGRYKVKRHHKWLIQYAFFKVHGQGIWPTIDRVFEIFSEVHINRHVRVPLSRATVASVMKDMGARQVTDDTRQSVIEEKNNVAYRHWYIRRLDEYREEGRPVVYLDETWVNQNMAPEHSWVLKEENGDPLKVLPRRDDAYGQEFITDEELADVEGVTPMKKNPGEGSQAILLHAGGYLGGNSFGFVNDGLLLFKGKKPAKGQAPNPDYHAEMNTECFMQWFKEKLLPNIPRRSVIVLDNARYHNSKVPDTIKPTTQGNKAHLVEWLVKHQVAPRRRQLGRKARFIEDGIITYINKSAYSLPELKQCAKDAGLKRVPLGKQALIDFIIDNRVGSACLQKQWERDGTWGPSNATVPEKREYETEFTKEELLDFVDREWNEQKMEEVFLTDRAADEAEKDLVVLRLPVATCQLNPIELCWAYVKQYIRRKNGAIPGGRGIGRGTSLNKVMEYTREVLGLVGAGSDLWRKWYIHAMKEEIGLSKAPTPEDDESEEESDDESTESHAESE